MENLSGLLRLPASVRLDDWQLDQTARRLGLTIVAQASTAQCPLCLVPSSRVHSRYERTLADLPFGEYLVGWKVRVRKFFCSNQQCHRKIFAERLAGAAAWARKTDRLLERLSAVGLALGGQAGSRLAHRMGLPSSQDTLLRSVHRLSLPDFPIPQTLGVDDFALRRCHTYGTILVDLDHRRPIALLASRDAATVADWLKKHPGVQTLSRDRSKAYRSAMNEGAPEAVQVADRFHLFKNFAESLERALEPQTRALRLAEAAWLNARAATSGTSGLADAPPPVPQSDEQEDTEYTARRRAMHEEIWELYRADWPSAAIARKVGVGVRTVQRDLARHSYSNERGQSNRGKCLLDRHRDYLVQLWTSGTRAHAKLLNALKERGYEGSEKTLYRFLKRLGKEGALPRRATVHSLVYSPAQWTRPALTPKRAAWLVLRTAGTRDADDEELLGQMRGQSAELSRVVELAEGFARMVRGRQHGQLDGWLEKAENSSVEALQQFAEGLRGDYDAVRAAMTLAVSNGPVEGQINRLKMLKRQMYGRAGMELLRRRFLLTTGS